MVHGRGAGRVLDPNGNIRSREMAVNEVSSFQNSAYGTNAAANRRPTSSYLGAAAFFVEGGKSERQIMEGSDTIDDPPDFIRRPIRIFSMYAIIEDSGTQIKLSKGDVVDIDLRDAEDGGTLILDKVLAIGDGVSAAKLGLPYLTGASVTVTVLGENDGDKIRSVKYKRRKGYRKTIGHRQSYLSVRVESITG